MKSKYLIPVGFVISIPIIAFGLEDNLNTLSSIQEAIPTINNGTYENNVVKLNWDTPIPDDSIFFNETFENLDIDVPNGIINNVYWFGNGVSIDPYGNTRPINDPVKHSLKVISGVGYNNTKGIQVTKTIPMQGWSYNYYNYLPSPNGGSNGSNFETLNWAKLETGRPAIVRLKAKGIGSASVSVASGWSGNAYIDNTFTWAENLTANEFYSRLINNQPIKINNPSGTTRTNYHLATAVDTTYSYNFLLSLGNIEQQNGYWVFKPNQWHGAWSDRVRPGQYVTPSNQRTTESITIGKPLYTLHSNPGGSGSTNINTSVWTDYSFNINIPNTKEIVDTGSYFKYSNSFSSADTLYIDEVKIAYAPQSKVYRDGNLVMGNSFTVEFTDINATDNAKPNEPSVSITYNDENKAILNWKEVEDNGTKYSYQVSSVNEFNQESAKSNPMIVNAKSGIKLYEIYLNDKLIGTTNNKSYTLSDNLNNSTKIKVVAVDNAGNKSNSKNIDIPRLASTVKTSENYIRLDWIMDNYTSKTYKVYQLKEGNNEYQSIGVSDFSTEVKVLNIYPVIDVASSTTKIPTETFINWKGESFTLPQSARLKKWMEEPNSENPKGYGKGIIAVDGVGIDEFNANPDKYLKNTDGTYKYNVIMIGSWDYNGNRFGNADMNQIGATKVQEFVDAGHGLLIGHDVASTINPIMLNQFKDDIKVEIKGLGSVNGTNIAVKKKGVLTNYPWNIDKQLTIPYTHTQSQVCYGDIWLEFGSMSGVTDNNGGYTNSYLTTNNNVAMIQTGHSRGQATPDEQKILANTLFYLNQLSSDNYLDDYSGQDVKAPNMPMFYGHNFTEDGFINLNFNSVDDNGSTYSYYVQAEDKKDLSVTSSNIVTETIKSGFKGYSYVIDSNSTTIPDDTIEQTTNETIKIKTNNNSELYVHIKAIDTVGNASETYHYRITDNTKPTLTLSLAPSSWTNNTVTINVNATDSASGLKYITLPNGNMLKTTSATYTVTQNGIYYFKAIDYMGNETISSINVSNIDKKNPTVTITNNQNWTNQDVQVNITATDE